jgi:16S rRNA (adenine1518-N6/adenine1519-N6)-dimethyltransferase
MGTRLGQVFLVNRMVSQRIIAACELKNTDTILEIGAGKGELTSEIARRVKRLVALEVDSRLCNRLRRQFADYSNTDIVNADILKFNIARYLADKKIKVIGNIPYYISTPIIEHLFKYLGKIKAIFLTLQKEYAQRLVAKPGSKEYSSFSCFVQYHTCVDLIFFIKKGSFSPIPAVDSAFMRLLPRRRPAVKVKDEGLFFRLIRLAFSQRRKTIKNNLRARISVQEVDYLLRVSGLNPNLRAEDLSLQDFANLANALSSSPY